MIHSVSRHLVHLLAGTALIACSQIDPDPAGTSGTTSLSIALTSASIAAVEAEVNDNGNAPAFAPIIQELDIQTDPDTGARLASGTIAEIPAGPQRAFLIRAFDDDCEVVCAGEGAADVIEGETTVVDIIVQCGSDSENNPPQITGFDIDESVWADGVFTSSATGVAITAHDPDDDLLTYEWTSDCGSFTADDEASTSWVAPDVPTECSLTVTVTDGRGGLSVLTLPPISVVDEQ